MTDIGPNRHLNKWLGGGFFVIAALPLYLGLQPLTFLPSDQWGWAIIPVAIAAVLIALGVYFWRTRPINAASIAFHDTGVRLDVRQIFRGEREYDVDWADVTEVTKFDGGMYGGRLITLLGDGRRPIASFSAAWTECSGATVLARLEASAEQAGFTFEKQPMSLASIVRTRWLLVPKP